MELKYNDQEGALSEEFGCQTYDGKIMVSREVCAAYKMDYVMNF